ncbi:MAG: radical SAM family heme chaperone HemW [Saprospiraceae bacterium]|nr:radical SAM family heme chaperone HemW [Saprospiraceae bacterium]
MKGLYIHIPFCKQACTYCNFHFSTNLRRKAEVVQALLMELELRCSADDHDVELSSIYLGGGTPSLLSRNDLHTLFDAIKSHTRLTHDIEITLEANPDDLDQSKLEMLADSPVNRLSIGVQSFDQRDLTYMHRAHNVEQAHTAISNAKSMGFSNISIDLIYGVPGMSKMDWQENLSIAFDYEIMHLSCYALTVEERTTLAHQVKTGQLPAPAPEDAESHFRMLMDQAIVSGYRHYEISNFAKQGYVAKHNTSYWKNQSYMGIGPSAHSFDGKARSWNVANNIKYVKAIQSGILPETIEVLTTSDRYNEYVMTGLRTDWGCRLENMLAFGTKYVNHFQANMVPYIKDGLVICESETYVLSTEGKLFADRIASDLFVV